MGMEWIKVMKRRREVSEAEPRKEKKNKKNCEPDFLIRQLPFRIVDPATAFRLIDSFRLSLHSFHVLSVCPFCS